MAVAMPQAPKSPFWIIGIPPLAELQRSQSTGMADDRVAVVLNVSRGQQAPDGGNPPTVAVRCYIDGLEREVSWSNLRWNFKAILDLVGTLNTVTEPEEVRLLRDLFQSGELANNMVTRGTFDFSESSPNSRIQGWE